MAIVNKLWTTGVDDHGMPLANGIVDPHLEARSAPHRINSHDVFGLKDLRAGTYFATHTGDPSCLPDLLGRGFANGIKVPT